VKQLSPATAIAVSVLIWSLPTPLLTRAPSDWPQWRGPRRDGIAAEKGLLKQWPTGGPPVAWTATGAGDGYSSFAVANGRLFTLGARGDIEYAIAFDAASGKPL
jgi:hypothetical protein